MRPFFTIIIATLNTEQTIERCLKNLLKQEGRNNFEILIKDGNSNDSTVSILKKYDKDIQFWESSPDLGIYDAWNSLLPRISGKWVIFLGSDDAFFNNTVLKRSYSILGNTEESIDIAYGKVRLVSKNNEPILDLGKSWGKTRKCIKEKMCMPHQGIFHRTTLFSRFGHFSTDYIISSDYDFIRKTISNDNVLYIDIVVSCMQIGGISSISKNTFARLKEVRKINQYYGSAFPGPLWLITYTNACFRHFLFLLIGKKYGKYFLDKVRRMTGLPSFWTKF